MASVQTGGGSSGGEGGGGVVFLNVQISAG